MEKRLRQIVYFSTASGRQDAGAIAERLLNSRIGERFDEISGLLVSGGNRYLHVIEGPACKVAALLKALRRDQSHLGLTILINRKIQTRSFIGPVAHFEEAGLGNFATLKQLIDRFRVRVIDRRLREEIDCFEQRFTVVPRTPVSTPWTFATSYGSSLTLDRSH